jgi:aryl-alcohol dehydrogenase-like predicted oxidoreductase
MWADPTGTLKRAEELSDNDWRAKNYPPLQGRNFDENLKLADFVRQVATQKGATPAQIVLAWLLQQGEEIVPIPRGRMAGWQDPRGLGG